MTEMIASSAIVIVEIALVLVVVFAVIGVIVLRKRRNRAEELRHFVSRLNGSAALRKEKRFGVAKEKLGNDIDDEVIEDHVDNILQKENSLYNKFVKVFMRQEGQRLEQIHHYVEELIHACHFKLPNFPHLAHSHSEDLAARDEIIESLQEENQELRNEVEKLRADNRKIMAEYEVIYEKHEQLTKLKPAARS